MFIGLRLHGNRDTWDLMVTRKVRLARRDSQGHYARQAGWKINAAGKRVQHKFRLGADPKDAERRALGADRADCGGGGALGRHNLGDR